MEEQKNDATGCNPEFLGGSAEDYTENNIWPIFHKRTSQETLFS